LGPSWLDVAGSVIHRMGRVDALEHPLWRRCNSHIGWLAARWRTDTSRVGHPLETRPGGRSIGVTAAGMCGCIAISQDRGMLGVSRCCLALRIDARADACEE